jgi:hypothetical protein
MKRSSPDLLIPLSLALLSAGTACTDLSGPPPCEGTWGDFPPLACAVLSAQAVGLAPGWVVLVVGPRDSGYSSSIAEIGADGAFQLLAMRYREPVPGDTATVTLGAFMSADSLTTSVDSLTPARSSDVLLHFALIGHRVDTTYAGVLTFR